ncbi:MAG: tetratricopeptide repeat protein [Candidatus Tectomicrobia bacterium]|nr:tetratricopeptide repeat protein [Candidatus Tectomicrobia bacterium]
MNLWHVVTLSLLTLSMVGCSSSQLLYLRGSDALSLGNYDAAISSFTLALLENPGHAGAKAGLGIAHYKQGEYEAAIDALEGARALDSKDKTVLLYLGLAHLKKGDLGEATEALEDFARLFRSTLASEQISQGLAAARRMERSEREREFIASSIEATVKQESRIRSLEARVQQQQFELQQLQRALASRPVIRK